MNASGRLSGLLDECGDPRLARGLLERLRSRDIRAVIMEVCGTHTVALFKTGIRSALPGGIRLISGPGCPVCVTPAEVMEEAIGLACRPDTLLLCFGDMMRVPVGGRSLEGARAEGGASVRVIYSPLEALECARSEPGTRVVLLGVGFETTAPLFASVLLRAREEGVGNLFFLGALRLIPPVLDDLLSRGEAGVDGLLLPGHVSAIIGERPYGFVASRYGVPGVIAGFGAADILGGVLLLLDMIEKGEARIANGYGRFVRPGGNPRAARIVSSVFEVCDADWRGLGTIPASGLGLRDEFARYDARALVDFDVPAAREPEGCACAEVVTGRRAPEECTLFGTGCTPDRPRGPCMVSREGTCAAHFRYGRGE